ncbi:PPOX class F420-dependent oxidoreductase [Mycolicibacterium insubricum]|jgi:PPOX class probable F420-dependent enzyme|uniref:PPOX class F420-dependent enzyme n=1 Tax=Mycolicibacterium insubricum TaxID=444597 RepID=A0A1X0DJJ4_9MYCO|nr:PPOX class F420-dependent oxidoreductase [Mycolicibacterium insubricum]MCB9441479.1 PPOX class F420-dependent oxidoreductase [Mycolicibacterium sp.]MCV7082944.1 PPOX class F420-dependent oxidoreductase [Mycolicibacterium insubricum]ORA72000.1 PPOX class F420-dependent enzyme [Mycolicibacterium insubricum]BBZ67538.1 PPOX class F420-dependent oxidoreductase [Mycolicibacterium insubricum]
MALTFADVAGAKYILLTTFTKDGRPKPTAVWAVPDGDGLIVLTEADSWKVKRIRNTPRVTIARCDVRGNPRSDAVEAVASISKERLDDAYEAIGRHYGLIGKVFNFFSKLRGGERRNVALLIKAA